MNWLADILAPFHFLRPAWLLAVPVAVLVWWLARRPATTKQGRDTGIAPHLLDHLTLNRQKTGRIRPIDLVAVVLLCATIAAAGPTWRRMPNPFFTETAPLVVALEVSDTMLASDVQPTRLERAKIKILDLVTLRAGARTALIAYSGSAHIVLPLTEDTSILKPFLEGLAPNIMPRKGQDAGAALSLAAELLAKGGVPGSILFVTDGIDASGIPAFAAHRKTEGASSVVALVVGTEEGGTVKFPDGGFLTDAGGRRVTAAIDTNILRQWERQGDVRVVRAGPGGADIREIERRVASDLRDALDTTGQTEWDDRGWLFIWPALLLALFWFRRGWTMPWVWVFVALSGVTAPHPARAEGFPDLWLTPDQQGRHAFERNRFSQAAEHFEDPMWRGVAAYRAGRYQEAATAFARVPTADGAFNMGNALVEGREYAHAVQAYEQALAEDPEHQGARANLEIAQAIITYLNRVRQQEDTGEQTELGADELKFDNTSGEGKKITITGDSKLSIEAAEQWMRAVDTQSSAFLKIRFALEAAQGNGQ